MNIKILGNGGAINDGLAYNAFVVNSTLLCETPPDIMLSIHKNSIDLPSIKTIYISHFGTHLRKEFETTDPRVNCARPGMDINF
jgi:hypothetical protein